MLEFPINFLKPKLNSGTQLCPPNLSFANPFKTTKLLQGLAELAVEANDSGVKLI